MLRNKIFVSPFKLTFCCLNNTTITLCHCPHVLWLPIGRIRLQCNSKMMCSLLQDKRPRFLDKQVSWSALEYGPKNNAYAGLLHTEAQDIQVLVQQFGQFVGGRKVQSNNMNGLWSHLPVPGGSSVPEKRLHLEGTPCSWNRSSSTNRS